MKLPSRAFLVLVAPLLLGAAPEAPAKDANREASSSTTTKEPRVQAEADLNALRKGCYGGRGAKVSRLVLSTWDRMALDAAAKEDHETMARWTLRALQGHGDELRLLPSYILAMESTESKLSDKAIESCNELLVRLSADEGS